MDRLNSSTSAEEVQNLDRLGRLKRNLVNPIIKDTVTVPDGGYTIIRFLADNPGFWLFHCHIEFHAEAGMSLVLKVGEANQMPRVPKDFPTCFDYIPSSENLLASGVQKIRYSFPMMILLIFLYFSINL